MQNEPLEDRAPESSASEQTNVETAQQDQEQLFRTLVDAHSNRLYHFILKHIGNPSDAEDLAQQTFVEAVHSYRAFRGDSQLSTWLYGIALNLVRNHLSRAPSLKYEFADESALEDMAADPHGPGSGGNPEKQLEQAQMLRHLQSAMDDLPTHMRDLLLLVAVDDLSYEEAAVFLTIPVGTVRSRLSRARAALNTRLQARGIDFAL